MLAVEDTDEVMLVTKDGQIVRTPASGISTIGRATQGVRCIHLRSGDQLVAVAKVPSDAEEVGEEPEAKS
jgi:DNA gyrase subunit A